MSKCILVIRRARSFSREKGISVLIASLLGVIFGILIFIWWITGTVDSFVFII